MTMKQLVAYGLIVSIAIAIITGIVEPVSEDGWYTLSGIGLGVFGIWASVILLRKPKE